MSIVSKALTAVAVAGLCLSASLYAGEGAPPKDGDGARMGPPDGGRGPGPRDGGDPRVRPPQGPPLLSDVKGMKEELQKHQATMKALQDQIREAAGKPEDRKDQGDPKAAPKGVPPALQAKLDEVAPKIVDEFVRHHQAVADLIKASRDEAIAKLKEHLSNPPPPPGQGGDAPGAPRGERGAGAGGPPRGGGGQNAPIPGERAEF